MAYIKNTWVNNETELNAQNMNHIEEGLENTQNVQLLAISDEEPAQCTTGDKYYNIDTKLIYTAVATNTWGQTGESPISDIIYIVFSEKGTYSYDGDELVSVGGGSIAYIGTEEPSSDNTSNLWINPDDVVTRQDNIVKTTYNESDDNCYSTNYINDCNTYSTSEIDTGKKWINDKPIYRKVYVNNNYSQNASTTSDISYALTNLDTIISVSGSAYLNNTNYVMPNSMWSNTSGMQYSWNVNGITSTGFKILTGSGTTLTNAQIYIVFEYTKTTD